MPTPPQKHSKWAGKSALTEHIKSAIDGLKYYHLEGDPQKGEPLQLVPRNLRKEFEKMLGVKIDGDLSPIARWKLLNEYDGKYEKFKVDRTDCGLRKIQAFFLNFFSFMSHQH